MIRPHFTKIEKKFNSLSMRERTIIFFALTICVFSMSYFWMLQPALLKQAKVEQALALGYDKEGELNQEIAKVKLRLKNDPLQEINDQIAFTLQTLTALDAQLDKKLIKFIHAQKMPIALIKVLSKSPGVKVESLISLPVEEFRTEQANDTVKGVKGVDLLQNLFYKHTLEMRLMGDYNAIYQYVLNLESLKEKFYWSSLSYQVTDYPLAEVVIQIYTLNDQKDLISG